MRVPLDRAPADDCQPFCEPATLRALLARQVGREAAEEIMTTAEMLRREGRREGKAEGRAEGKREGKVEGKRDTLLLLLRQRFGRLPAAAVARIGAAGIEQLDVWSSRVLTAPSLDDMLPSPLPRRRVTVRAREGGARR